MSNSNTSKMHQVLEYKGHRFNIEVQLHFILERRMDGKHQHLVTVNDMGSSNYIRKYHVDNATMINDINGIILDTKAYVDAADPDVKIKNALIAIGFEPI